MSIKPKHRLGPTARLKQLRAKLKRKKNVLDFAFQLRGASTPTRVAIKSIREWYPVKVREARQAVKLAKPKKHRARRKDEHARVN